MTEETRRPVIARLADVVFYGPLGMALERRRVLPQMASRGRRQVAFTRTIGQFAVRHGRQRLEALVEGLSGDDQVDGQPQQPAPTALTTNASPAQPSAASAASLAIPQYDSLSAIQVVPRLDGLSDAELTQLRDYETATRSRRTILAKISQLQQ